VLAGIDFFTVEVLSWRGLAAPCSSVDATDGTKCDWGGVGIPGSARYALHDRDTKFCSTFRATLAAGGIEPIQLPARSPNLNSHAERWVRSVKGECLSKLILFGEVSLRRALNDFIDHFHAERNHQGKGNILLFPLEKVGHQKPRSRVRCHERLGGLLKYYRYAA
jgi:transposase InsO family protein